MTIVIDETHLDRRASGIERVTRALFSEAALAPLPVRAERAPGGARWEMLLKQSLTLPAKAAAERRSVWVFPGFPPSPAFTLLRRRAVLYVHDVFLLARRGDLNFAGRYWLAPAFWLALRRFRYFMANSCTTAAALRPLAAKGARIVLYRPRAENVFGLTPRAADAPADKAPLRIAALGTVEPRKNFPAAARICERLAAKTGRRVELHIVGRQGWGHDYEALAQMPHVRLHGFLAAAAVRALLADCDLYLCTSHDEGLGLPLLEAQYGGLQVAAPDKPVFREVLGRSGLFVDPCKPDAAADIIAACLAQPDMRQRAAAQAAANIARWNTAADGDRQNAIEFLGGLLNGTAR